jgi:Ni,Fe-hydrogenase maturation factor
VFNYNDEFCIPTDKEEPSLLIILDIILIKTENGKLKVYEKSFIVLIFAINNILRIIVNRLTTS